MSMEIINIESTSKTPSIKFDYSLGKLEIKGKSITENAIYFYKPIINSLKIYACAPKPYTQVEIQLDYFNTATSKCLYQILKQLESINSGATQVSINWFYDEDDKDILEAGEDYQAKLNLPFNFEKKQPD